MKIDDKVTALFDYAVSKPEGFTYVDVKQDIGWGRPEFFQVVRAMRMVWANDTITLPCDPQGVREPWLYRLVGLPEEARDWQLNRLEDCRSRLKTIEAVSLSIVNGTDGRTIEGRMARLIETTARHLGEQLDLMEVGVGGTA